MNFYNKPAWNIEVRKIGGYITVSFWYYYILFYYKYFCGTNLENPGWV